MEWKITLTKCPFKFLFIAAGRWMGFTLTFLHCEIPLFKAPHEVCLAAWQEKEHREQDPVSKRGPTRLHAATVPYTCDHCLQPFSCSQTSNPEQEIDHCSSAAHVSWISHYGNIAWWDMRCHLNKCENWPICPCSSHICQATFKDTPFWNCFHP